MKRLFFCVLTILCFIATTHADPGNEETRPLNLHGDIEALQHEQPTQNYSFWQHIPTHPLNMHDLLNVQLQDYLPDTASIRQQAVKVVGCITITGIAAVAALISYQHYYS